MQINYDQIFNIYNPNSTGDAPAIASKLAKDLKKHIPPERIKRTPTKYAGHAEKLAYKAASSVYRPLIVSVSGDGGFHEVINGVVRSGNVHAVVAVEGAGNANDNWRVVHNKVAVINRIKNKPKKIALLKLTTTHPELSERYAHSYIGFGMSAKVAHELNKQKLNRFNEKVLLFRSIFKYGHFKLYISGNVKQLESLVAANINEMAKTLHIDTALNVQKPTFRLIQSPHTTRMRRIVRLFHAATSPKHYGRRMRTVHIETASSVWIQCDGEPTRLPSSVSITIVGVADGCRTI